MKTFAIFVFGGNEMEVNQYLVEYYNRGLEDGRLDSQHGSVEFLTTMRYIERYLKPYERSNRQYGQGNI